MGVWEEFSADSERSIKKVLAGPMGVGKSYLALFLVAKAYSEGWPVLYVADAADLVKSDLNRSGEEICKRFFALNKDILTVGDLENLWIGRVLSKKATMEEAKIVTNNVPRELNKLVKHITECGGKPSDSVPTIKGLIKSFEEVRYEYFYGVTERYFTTKLDPRQRQCQLSALSRMFQPDGSGFLESYQVPSRSEFKDQGLVYRVRVGGRTKYQFLCPPAKHSLLDFYRVSPLPEDLEYAIKNESPSGDEFERAISHGLLNHRSVTLSVSQMQMQIEPKVPLRIQSEVFDMITKPPSKVNENVLWRCYKEYPRFDFIYNQTFIQVLVQSFACHDVETAMISKVFDPPKTETSTNNSKTNGKGKGKRRSDDSDDSTESPREDSDEIAECSRGTWKKRRVGTRGDRKSDEETSDSSAVSSEGDSTVTTATSISSDGLKSRNQIEVYLDTVFGGKHVAKIDPNTKHFIVSKDNKPVDDFRIVFISGKPSPPRCDKVNDYPDLLHVNFNEIIWGFVWKQRPAFRPIKGTTMLRVSTRHDRAQFSRNWY
ncbi:hypothetical protein BGZ76_002366 [Entomortierella beljakovae]|nr:hypothetical protein BGZ76_002366 [Entomortierella beljakovae]